MKKTYLYKNAFSLVEILVSILIISAVLVLALPVLTKRALRTEASVKGGSIGFYYKEASLPDDKFPCYVTELDINANTVITNTDGKCERYTFTVPSDVNSVDLTLVAGGGGGGGAAGGFTYVHDFISSKETSINGLPKERLKDIKINFLTGKGQNGLKRNDVSNSAEVFAGKGGNSGVAILNLTLPVQFRKWDYTPNFLKEVETNPADKKTAKDTISLKFKQNGADDIQSIFSPLKKYDGFSLIFEENKNATGNNAFGMYQVADGDSVLSSEQSLECVYGEKNAGKYGFLDHEGKEAPSYKDGLYNNCGITKGNYLLSATGEEKSLPVNSDKYATGFILQGGIGGKHAGEFSTYGTGGRGESIVLTCGGDNVECKLPNNSKIDGSVYEDYFKTMAPEDGAPAYGNVSISVEHPGGTGTGGVGGSAVKINNFKVTPGATYTIVVGSGGEGGHKGTAGHKNEKGDITEAQNGLNGEGGSASAIYDENGTLLLLVAGGVGGFGGQTIDTSSIKNTNYMQTYLPTSVTTPKNIPLLFVKNTLENLNFDDNVVIDLANASNITTTAPGFNNLPLQNTTAYAVINSYLVNDNIPLYELNSNNSLVATGDKITKTNSYENFKTGGFNRFYQGEDINSITKQANAKYNDVTNPNIYNGLHFRYNTGGVLSYAGGLGGFSGLASKGGCGGLFVGNYDGRTKTGFNEKLKNTFAVNVNNSIKIFDVNSFYSGCSTLTSDGHMAEFVPPSVSTGMALDLGQAGAGGGGGGWNSLYGAGNGGRGQNGYVFISWRK